MHFGAIFQLMILLIPKVFRKFAGNYGKYVIRYKIYHNFSY